MQVSKIDQGANLSNSERDCVMTGPGAISRRVFNPYTQTDSSSVKQKPVATESPFDPKNINPVEAHRLARNAFLNYFKNTFAETDQFKAVFGTETWDDLAGIIIDGVELHRQKGTEMAEYRNQAYVFAVEVAGMSGEVVIDKKSGNARKISVDPS